MSKIVLLDYTSMNGGNPANKTPREITDAWATFFSGFDRTHHQIVDFAVNANGDTATVHLTGKADHFIGNEVWTVEGTYDTGLQKENNGWRIAKLKFNFIRQSGNTDLPARATEIAANKKTITLKKVKFQSEGIELVGVLRSPNNSGNKKLPLIIIAPSWINVKEQFAAIYGDRLAALGYYTLIVDFRNYGESGGTPRNYEVPLNKVTDIKNALQFAETLPEVDADNIYMLGICAGAGHVAMASAGNPKVKKIALVASWLHDAEAVKLFYGGAEGVADKIQKSKAAQEQFKNTGVIDYAPKASLTDPTAAMYGDFSYYLDKKRGLIPEWEIDQFAVMSWEPWLTFDANPYASKISCPVLMVHSEQAALPGNAKVFFAAITHAPKTIYWTQGNQFDFYDGKQVEEAIKQIVFFFQQ